MQPHFADEWQRLTRAYEEKSDEELLELSADFGNLTDAAQQVLRDELRQRRLPAPRATQEKSDESIASRWSPIATAPSPQSSIATEPAASALPREYTWKTLLCECRDQEHAWQLSAILKDAGIESWIEIPRGELDLTGPRLLVAADQLDEARAIAERPIPQDVIDQSKAQQDDFAPPLCPKCGAPDPLLLGVDPANTWRCDICGAQWTDSLPAETGDAQPA